ncbi:hypothetical protein [Caballeronia sp. J97]|uniref:hypothetical protein n=1 Tax=Caballeronia sp. J97 TaxID=2805429 RepID=UPI0039EE5B06
MLLLLLQFQLLLALLFLLLRLFLRFSGGFLLTRLDFRAMLRRFLLLLLVALRLLLAVLRILYAARTRLVKLFLIVRLLAIVRRLIGRALRRLGVAPGGGLRVLTLLVLVSLLTLLLVRRPLRRFRFVLRPLDRRLLVALLRALGALLVIERELFLADLLARLAQFVARVVETVIHEELAVAVVFFHAVAVIIFLGAPVEHLLTLCEFGFQRVIGALRARGAGRRRIIEGTRAYGRAGIDRPGGLSERALRRECDRCAQQQNSRGNRHV